MNIMSYLLNFLGFCAIKSLDTYSTFGMYEIKIPKKLLNLRECKK